MLVCGELHVHQWNNDPEDGPNTFSVKENVLSAMHGRSPQGSEVEVVPDREAFVEEAAIASRPKARLPE